jgi:hypothetical protein
MWRMEQVVSMPHPILDLARTKTEVSLVGVVDGSWEDGKWPFRVLQVHTQDQVIESSDRVLVSSGQYTRPRFGQELVLSGKLTEPKPFDDFDYPAYLRMKGVSALMYMPRYDVPERSLTSPIQRAYWRVRFVQHFVAAGGAEAARETFAATLVGGKFEQMLEVLNQGKIFGYAHDGSVPQQKP